MPRKGKKGKKLGVNNISKGFCISCGATRSSKFRLAQTKWEAFYEHRNDKRREKKGRVCTRCYIRFNNADYLSQPKDEDQQVANSTAIDQKGTIVKPSPIGGNGLFAFRDYEKGQVVAEYGGRILALDETEGKDSSYFRVIGIDKRNGVIDGRYKFGNALGRYINTPTKGNHPNCTWGKFNEKTQTTPIKTNKAVRCGEEFTIRYSPTMRIQLHSKKRRGRPPNK